MPRSKVKTPRQKPPHGLTPKQVAFAVIYAGCGNATEAAKLSGYSPKTAASQGSMLLKTEGVAALVEQERSERWKRLQMDGDEVLARAALIARSNIKTLMGENGEFKNPGSLAEMDAFAVAGIEAQLHFEDDGAPPEKILKVKMRDPMPALRLLAQHHKLIGAEVEVNVTADLVDRLASARKRARANVAETP
jgi:hypothetical protein